MFLATAPAATAVGCRATKEPAARRALADAAIRLLAGRFPAVAGRLHGRLRRLRLGTDAGRAGLLPSPPGLRRRCAAARRHGHRAGAVPPRAARADAGHLGHGSDGGAGDRSRAGRLAGDRLQLALAVPRQRARGHRGRHRRPEAPARRRSPVPAPLRRGRARARQRWPGARGAGAVGGERLGVGLAGDAPRGVRRAAVRGGLRRPRAADRSPDARAAWPRRPLSSRG